MARPNSSGAIAGKIQGLRELKAAFQALPEIVRTKLLEATETTARAIARNAQANLQSSPSIDTRSLYNHVKWQVTKTNGRGKVGIANGTTTVKVGGRRIRVKGILIRGKGGSALKSQGAKLIKPSRYAHIVERGSKYMKAEPFMRPAAEAQKQPYVQRCREAGPGIEKAVAAIGMRTS